MSIPQFTRRLLTTPLSQIDNPCYRADRAYEQGYDDGRWFSARRRPGAVRGADPNYDSGFAAGVLDAMELDGRRCLEFGCETGPAGEPETHGRRAGVAR